MFYYNLHDDLGLMPLGQILLAISECKFASVSEKVNVFFTPFDIPFDTHFASMVIFHLGWSFLVFDGSLSTPMAMFHACG